MKSNSNTNITNFTVDPVTQQITSLEVNGEVVETGGSEPVLQNKAVTIDSMEQFDVFATGMYVKSLEPSEGYDGLSKATFQVSSSLLDIASMKMVTLKNSETDATKEVVIQNSNIDSYNFQNIGVFSGKLYVPGAGTSTGTLNNTSYTLETGPCGGSKIVTIGTSTFDKIKLSWD